MSDKRAFAVLDVGYFENPKMMDVLDASSIAVSMHIASVLYCSQHLTDGVISTRAICRKIGGTDADVQTLVDAELWHLPGHSCDSCPDIPEGKAYVHDYLEHNRSSEGAKRTSKKAKAAAEARWAKEKATTPTDAISHAESNAPSMPDALPVAVPEPMPDAMHRQTDRQTETKPLTSEIEISDQETRSDVEAIIDRFSQKLHDNDVRFKVGKAWHDSARLLLDKDGYTVEQVKYVIDFATTDDFWKSNILSVPKLREKFEQLKIKAQSAGPGRTAAEQRHERNLQVVRDLMPTDGMFQLGGQ